MPAFVVALDQVQGRRLVLRGPEAHHLVRVRRHRVGDQVEVLDGRGRLYQVRVAVIEADQVLCDILECREGSGEDLVQFGLAPALTKGQRFDGVVEKATELGVAHLHPVVAAWGVVGAGSENRLGRWQRIALAAAKQCGRSCLPVVDPPAPLEQVLRRLVADCEMVLMAVPAAPALDVRGRRPTRVGLLVGPEGGFTPEEEDMARQAGAELFSWGGRILRADTAAVVLTAVVMHEIEQARTGKRGG